MTRLSSSLPLLLLIAPALGVGCAMGEMPQAEQVDGDVEHTDDDGATPLTTSADDGDDPGEPHADDDATGDGAGDVDATDEAGSDDDPVADGTTGGFEDTTGGGNDASESDAGSSSGTDTGEPDDTGTNTEPFDLSGFELVQTSSDRTIALPADTVLPAGAYLVVGRNASRAAFEAFWGPLPVDAVYVDGATIDPAEFPTINGDETYALRDAGGGMVDGPSAPLVLAGNLQRVDPGEPAPLEGSWSVYVDANADATPGGGQVDSPLFSGVYVSELSDANGAGSYVYEFVELYHDP